MAIELINTPAYQYPVSPPIYSRWLATECPNNFTFVRKDYLIVDSAEYSGNTRIELGSDYGGLIDNTVSIIDDLGNSYAGEVTLILDSPARNIVCDIPWNSIAGTPEYMNDHTLRGGYYVEGKLTVNGVEQALTVIASPDSKGIANLDVSGILRIMVSIGKDTDNTELLDDEKTKSGSFTLAYHECWYGNEESYIEEGNTWYYIEAVRSVEQGSNLYEFIPNEYQYAPFLNSFTQPVYFLGLPFDISFVLPPQPVTSPAKELEITIKHYNATNIILSTDTQYVPVAGLEGRVISLNIDPSGIEESAAYMTAEIAIV